MMSTFWRKEKRLQFIVNDQTKAARAVLERNMHPLRRPLGVAMASARDRDGWMAFLNGLRCPPGRDEDERVTRPFLFRSMGLGLGSGLGDKLKIKNSLDHGMNETFN